MSHENLDVAVIGGGVSGITAAYLLQQRHRVSLYERNDYVGGHTHTVIIPDGPDA
ncbi:MAG: FAD-dependent oxidoreductase, partial [Desulfobacterales bacterium]|nr:FAD-dependent oxidoreductase [Desulfobacterales bacterium]